MVSKKTPFPQYLFNVVKSQLNNTVILTGYFRSCLWRKDFLPFDLVFGVLCWNFYQWVRLSILKKKSRGYIYSRGTFIWESRVFPKLFMKKRFSAIWFNVWCALLASRAQKNLDCHFSGVASGISLHWYAELIPDRTPSCPAVRGFCWSGY